jgi:hypothetical protein
MREELHKAGTTFDGHVTNGSLDAQIKAIVDFLESERGPDGGAEYAKEDFDDLIERIKA